MSVTLERKKPLNYRAQNPDDGNQGGAFIWSKRVRLLRRLAALALVCAFFAGITGGVRLKELPSSETILPELENDPVQQDYDREEFIFPFRGERYTVKPVAQYSITGLLVTHNNINAFDDIYHTSDSVDIRDLCLIWGENVATDLYHDVEFWSEPFSCWVRPKSQEAARTFRQDQLSNTHVLAADSQVREQVLALRIGDQVRLTGALVNYYPVGRPEAGRRTSTTRTDRGNGACETMLIQEVEVLKRGDPTPHRLYRFGITWGGWLTVLLMLLWIVQAQLESRRL